MSEDLKELTVEQMLEMKDQLNKDYECLIVEQNKWLERVQNLRNEMQCRSLDLEIMEEEAKANRQSDFDHLYEAKNKLH